MFRFVNERFDPRITGDVVRTMGATQLWSAAVVIGSSWISTKTNVREEYAGCACVQRLIELSTGWRSARFGNGLIG